MSNAELAIALLQACEQRGIMLATAESCTGGLIIAALTDIAGSSAVVDRGFITYSNEAKMEMLGVSAATLDAHGAVSRETVLEMADGALAHSRASLSLAVTGIAGPTGGSAEKPVGLVWFGVALTGQPVVAERQLFGHKGREFIRHGTVRHALQLGLRALA
ncbi:CinA family protein [Mesorhizobium sp. M1C.F.Ca.ET.193.01.1.1]|uniref:CinA family protein n=1 Tax=unclassified Mesorhizobium TaxID=325217 RepID=UPI000FD54FBC|nr:MULTISPECIES: CinA family protein [unclassified Mesorhizobium]TGT03399.1 CinA family protein [bacterium M00.F.Ca.ET.177.01.1.1]TGQ56081.1 CinA family protein [Mesorhizobium sp. M1C.F.Ca.ET.210.01.1.1]TGQ75166.1 CinA family protein [Mesorhizobium sp. M1C.F.Ca.ET.212.01.1.1]TGR13578.1 CinA family protein [Mesorhizobium sp. M1C.F.Ca.ET.204.01.1.1]TGR33854.1 CinA family protein [Mesorhizobium sp. M1C.F.Ca.ET.196.01.1.1]